MPMWDYVVLKILSPWFFPFGNLLWALSKKSWEPHTQASSKVRWSQRRNLISVLRSVGATFLHPVLSWWFTFTAYATILRYHWLSPRSQCHVPFQQFHRNMLYSKVAQNSCSVEKYWTLLWKHFYFKCFMAKHNAIMSKAWCKKVIV